MFNLIIAPKALKKLKKISKQYQIQSIKEIFNEIREDPLMGKPLEDELKGEYSYKVSVYRILYKVDWKDKTVTILNADHRSVVYKK